MTGKSKQLLIAVDENSEYYKFTRSFSFTKETKRHFEIVKYLINNSKFSEITHLMPIDILIEYYIYFTQLDQLISAKQYIDNRLDSKIDSNTYEKLSNEIQRLEVKKEC